MTGFNHLAELLQKKWLLNIVEHGLKTLILCWL